jgi:hypothetical protein
MFVCFTNNGVNICIGQAVGSISVDLGQGSWHYPNTMDVLVSRPKGELYI